MSPSFSRSSSSTTTTALPAAMSAIASLDGVEADACWSWARSCGPARPVRAVDVAAGEQLLDVLGDHVDLEVDRGRRAARKPSVVRARVSGIRLTVKLVVAGLDDGEGDAVDGDRALVDEVAAPARRAARSRRAPSARWACGRRTVPTPSTWPWTMWPPSRLSAVTARSRLTRSPGRDAAEGGLVERLLHDVGGAACSSVVLGDGEAAAVDRDRVAQRRRPRATSGPRTVRRTASPWSSTASTVPSSSTMPVNMSVPPLVVRHGDPDVAVAPAVVRRATVTSVDRRGGSASAMVPMPRSPTALRPAPSSIGAT